MDTDEIFQTARARFEHAAARKALREKYEAKMIFTHDGGMWRAGPELQTMLLTCPDSEAVIPDLYQTPVKVDTKELYTLSQQRWQEQMNGWLEEYNEINRKR